MTFSRMLTLAALAAIFSDPTLMVRICAVTGLHTALMPLYRQFTATPAWDRTGLALAICAVLA